MTQSADMKIIPKCHMLIHMVLNIGHQGSPKHGSTYADEHMNGVVARIARSVHLWTFYGQVLKKYTALQKLSADSGK